MGWKTLKNGTNVLITSLIVKKSKIIVRQKHGKAFIEISI
jgi:hypothetical protein